MNQETDAARTLGDGEQPTSIGDGTESAAILDGVSKAMVQLFKEQFGRGPTKARSSFAGPDTLICLLENTFTPAEQNLATLGEHERIRDVRHFFQHSNEDQFRRPVEQLTGRRVRSFMSGVDTHNDAAVEVFILESDENEGD